jgi:hypothetical protein
VGWVLVIPCIAGAQQGLKSSGFGGRDRYPSELCDRLQAGVWRRLVAGIPVVMGLVAQPRGRYSGMVWPAQLRDVYPAMCGYRIELWPGAAGWVESLAEWSSISGNLQGRDLSGRLFLY